MTHFKLTLSYDGTPFVGWQRQAAGVSIQGLLEDALAVLDGQPVAVAGAGRTDAGVHALGQVASVTLRREIDAETLVRAMNARLPPEVRIVAAAAVAPAFHARFSQVSKVYRYRIWNTAVLSPIERAFVWHYPVTLDVVAMHTAAQTLVGRHDFSAFQGTGTAARSAEREIFTSRVVHASSAIADNPATTTHRPPLVVYEVSGDGFLKHMVRNIVGTLIEVGRGRRPPEWVADVLLSRQRARAGETAPPSGLFLVSVTYPDPDL